MAYTLDKNTYRAQQFTRGRSGNAIRYIVIHHWDDPAKKPQFHAVCNYLINPAGREVSAHYIAEAGRVVQMVDESDTAWHCGNWVKNQQSIGIECNPRCSEADLDTVAELCADIMKRHGKLTILGHKDCSPTGCPGRYYPPSQKLAPYLAKYLNGGSTTTDTSNSGKTAILGKSKATLAAMEGYLKRNSPNYERFKDLPRLYVEEAEREGVCADIAFAQAVLETGHFKFGGDVSIDQNNFAGIGAVGGGAKGASFPDLRTGVRAQNQHLIAYAEKRSPKTVIVDPRFSLVRRGSAPYVEWLGIQENPQRVGWASGKDYGAKILKIRAEICALGENKEAASSTAATLTHTVVHGDTLWAIAEKYLGDGRRYEEIKRLNGLSSNVIYSGQVLKISGNAPKPDIDALADAVIRGDYGVGAERMKRLGSLYAEVQARVNEKLGY